MTNNEANREIDEYLKRKEEEERRLKEALIFGSEDDAEPATIPTVILSIAIAICVLAIIYIICSFFSNT